MTLTIELICLAANIGCVCAAYVIHGTSVINLREAQKTNDFATRRLEAMNDILTRMQKKT